MQIDAPSVWPSSLTKRFLNPRIFKMLQYALKCNDMHLNASGASKIAYQCSSSPSQSTVPSPHPTVYCNIFTSHQQDIISVVCLYKLIVSFSSSSSRLRYEWYSISTVLGWSRTWCILSFHRYHFVSMHSMQQSISPRWLKQHAANNKHKSAVERQNAADTSHINSMNPPSVNQDDLDHHVCNTASISDTFPHDYRQFIISLLYQRSLLIRAIIARSILKNDRLSHWFSDELIEDNQGKDWEEIDAKRKTI